MKDSDNIRPTTPWWVWALAILLTAAVVFVLLDAVNAPEPGGVNPQETVQ